MSATGLLFLVVCLTALGQPKSGLRTPETLSPAEAEKQGRALVAELLAQHPEKNSTNIGVMRIRDTKSNQREVPVRFAVISQSAAWLNTYDSSPVGSVPAEKLTILHSDTQPNQYTVARVSPGNADSSASRQLSGNQTMVPFAGSDFWVADLGLEFLHWPKQLLLKKEMRRSRSCNVLDSINPQPVAGGYSRVRCWLDIESGGIVMAEAYDAQDKLLKEFAPKEIKKIEGEWQLEEMEIRNVQAGSRTRVIFDLGH
ncbi:MAG TPA: outer membrane lipoprotein-sorting protein [Candidatus Limnocylindrales bacterium]|nr:outer membrane lipoprotein-sorting protein [Candidatus Limnocylindrales bacterium]